MQQQKIIKRATRFNQPAGAGAMTNAALVTYLKENKACAESLEWLGTRDLIAMWNECDRGDWLLWFCVKWSVDRKLIVAAACGCARLALPYVTDDRPRKAIETAEAWCHNEATIAEVRASVSAASAAYAVNAYAANAAAYAANAANADADAVNAAHAAYAAVVAAAYAANAERPKKLKTCADIVRRMIPFEAVAR